LDLEKRLPQEREQDLQARVRAVQGQTLDRDGDLEALLQSMGGIVKTEGWKGKITPSALIQLTSEVPSLFAYPVVVDVSVPADFSRGSRESDQVRFLRLLRKLDALPAKHQLVGVEILSNVQGGFSAKCTYHYYKVRRG
jgi:hypothetical protein